MSLIHRHGTTTVETPEQTLERLDRASSGHRVTVPDEPRKPRFKVRHIAATYNMVEVDTFIDSIDQRTADEIHNVHFTTGILRGYDMVKVDQFLDECEARLNAAAGAPSRASRSALTPADPIREMTGPTPAHSPVGQNKPRSQRAGNVLAGVFWSITLGGGLYLWILIEEDSSWSEAVGTWLATVIGLGLLGLLWLGIDKLMGSFSELDGSSWWHGGAGWMSEQWDSWGDGGDGGCDGGGFDGGGCDGG